MTDTPKRNDPCHCGSGKKYKNCCLEKDESKLMPKLGIIGIVVVVLLGAWLMMGNFSSNEPSPQDCPTGTVWSQAHHHCH